MAEAGDFHRASGKAEVPLRDWLHVPKPVWASVHSLRRQMLGMVVHASNPSYTGSMVKRSRSQASLGKKHETLSKKIMKAKKDCWS
jgi:hypothetical protein